MKGAVRRGREKSSAHLMMEGTGALQR